MYIYIYIYSFIYIHIPLPKAMTPQALWTAPGPRPHRGGGGPSWCVRPPHNPRPGAGPRPRWGDLLCMVGFVPDSRYRFQL